MILGDLLILVVALLVAALVLAPLESLYWWATRGAEETETVPAPLDKPEAAKALAEGLAAPEGQRRKFLVYLSGIGALAAKDVPEEEFPFVQDLHDRLEEYTVIDDVFPYAVDNRGLTAERILGRMWRWLEKVRLKNPNALLAVLINLRNLMQLFVCADRRYGPTYNMGTAGEIHRSLRTRAFVRALQALCPEIRASDLVASAAGVRAQAIDASGRLLDDFAFATTPRSVHVVNAPSPAATASLAIGRAVAARVDALVPS